MNDDPDDTEESPGSPATDAAAAHAADLVRDAVDIAVGLGIMAFNRVQSVRREVARDRAATPADDADGGPAPGGRPSQ